VDEATQDADWEHGIDLAREPAFDLGQLRVHPATCTVETEGRARDVQRRIMQVLVALARARGDVVSQDTLIVACWRGLSVSDDAIYRCISILRKLAAQFEPAPFTIEAIPGVGYRLTTVPGDGARQSAIARTRRPAVFAAIVVLSLVVSLTWLALRSEQEQSTLVVVQRFEATGKPDIARALAGQVVNGVVNVLGEGHIEAVLDDGKQRRGPVTPGLVVTGLLRADAPVVVVDVRVEDGATRAALWSGTFRRNRTQAANLPLEVGAKVADIVNMTNFARTASPRLTDQAGLSALLQASDAIRDAHGGAWAPMVENAENLVASHPDFAFGHSILAAAYAEAADSIEVPSQAAAMRESARREANLTLKLDPQDAGAPAVLWGILPPYAFEAQERILLRGIKTARHPKEPLGALYSYEGTVLSSVGRLREALPYQLIARATDEWGPPKTVKLALNYANVGDLPTARRWLRHATSRWPDHSAVRSATLYMAAFLERPADGQAAIESMGGDGEDTAIWRQFITARSRRESGLVEATLAKARQATRAGTISPETEIMMIAGLGVPKQALVAAERALDDKPLDPRFLFTPPMREVRRDAGFVRLAARMGLIRYWRTTGRRPDFCTGTALSTECPAALKAALHR
jgi:DNA-binding winged helix-turn-helix (wHTH) protein